MGFLSDCTVTCKLCGYSSSFITASYSTSLGWPDLDTRPPETTRSNLPFWIQRCPHCGYCAPDLSQATLQTAAFTGTKLYQIQLHNRLYPQLANSFLCHSLIEEQAGDFRNAGWAKLRAAWVCDDLADDQAAFNCRLGAILVFNLASTEGDNYASDAGTFELVKADLNRRCGFHGMVREICEQGLGKKVQDVVHKALSYEIVLAQRHDSDCHTVDEAYKTYQFLLSAYATVLPELVAH
jgi:hypothetical protein